ncbi:MAG: hypothetical protein ABW153_14430, partial [Sedimenticola sp.]
QKHGMGDQMSKLQRYLPVLFSTLLLLFTSQSSALSPKLMVVMQASLRSRDALWDIQVPKTHSIFDSLFMPRPPCVRCLAIRPFVSHPKTTTANG